MFFEVNIEVIISRLLLYRHGDEGKKCAFAGCEGRGRLPGEGEALDVFLDEGAAGLHFDEGEAADGLEGVALAFENVDGLAAAHGAALIFEDEDPFAVDEGPRLVAVGVALVTDGAAGVEGELLGEGLEAVVEA